MKCKKVLAALTAAAVVSGVPIISVLAEPQTITEYDFDTSKPEKPAYSIEKNTVDGTYGNSAWLHAGANRMNVDAPPAGYESAIFSFEAGREKLTGALRLVLVGSDDKQYHIVQIAAQGGSLQKFTEISNDKTAASVTDQTVYANAGYMHTITCVVTGNKFDVYIGKGKSGAFNDKVESLQSNATYGYVWYSGNLPYGVSVKTFRLQEHAGGTTAWQWMIDNVSLTADYGREDKINTLDKLKSAIDNGVQEITIAENTSLSIAADLGKPTTQLILNKNQKIIVPEGSSILGFGTIYAEKDGSAVVYKKAENDKSVDYSFTGKLTYNKDASQPHPINDNTMCVSSDGMTGFIQSVKDFTGKTKVTITTLDEKTAELSLAERFPTMTDKGSVVFGLIITDAGNTKITSVTVK